MITWVVDNDILFKGTCYGFLETLLQAVDSPEQAGVLGQARFVLPKKLRKRPPSVGAQAAVAMLESSLASLQQIEPTDAEISLAAALEFEAVKRDVAFDSGESILTAVAAHRNLACIFTGDKRAIIALQALIQDNVEGIATIKQKCICLEQGCKSMIDKSLATTAQIRRAICENRSADTALYICFSCSSPELADTDEGLLAYIDHLRKNAPDALRPSSHN